MSVRDCWHPVGLSHAIEPGSIEWNNEGERIERLMDAGDLVRAKLDRGDAMALLGALGIAAKRRDLGQARPCAFVVRPDKYIGYRGRPVDIDRLMADLARRLPAAASARTP